MEAIVEKGREGESEKKSAARGLNVNKTERQLSLASGVVLLGLGLRRGSKLSNLFLAGVGAALTYRGMTGHCHLYNALGMNTRSTDENAATAGVELQEESEAPSYGGKNQLDKDRFDKLLATQVERGRDEDRAIEIAAEEVKELRRREGRSKEEQLEYLEELDAAWERKNPAGRQLKGFNG